VFELQYWVVVHVDTTVALRPSALHCFTVSPSQKRALGAQSNA
jgi:hypothetical protein